MDLLLGLLLKVSREYGFSAFVLALLMMIFYWIVTNKQLIAVADKVLNQSLTSTNLYKFIRLAVVLVFVFSLIVALLSFATPVFMRQAENRSLELVLRGKSSFQSRNYPEARTQLQSSLALMSPDAPTAEEVRGLITATYYVSDLHEEGLEFICQQYTHKPIADTSYLYSVHAHLRKLAVSKGAAAAEAIAVRFRKKCSRNDFSRFWAHIPFGMMESLRTSKLRTEHGWELSQDSAPRLRNLLQEEQQAWLAERVPFGDFALYFLGEFDELLAIYVDSPIRDMAYFDAAMFAALPKRLDYLTTLIERHPKSPRFEDAVVRIVDLLASQGQRDKAVEYVALLAKREAVDRAAYAALKPTFDALSKMIRDGKIESARALAEQACTDFRKKSLACIKSLERELNKTDRALKVSTASYPALRCTRVQTRLRELSVLEDKSIDVDWLHASRAFLVSCLEGADADPEDYARSLYLIAAVSRRVGDYKTSFDYLLRFQREITDHDLLDDVMAEIGYHRMVIQRDWQAAKPVFEEVISKYANRNAYDNALWWYAKGQSAEGEYAEAIAAYGKIMATELTGRLKKWSSTEQRALQRLTELPPFEGVTLRTKNADEIGLFIARLADDAPARKILSVGDRLVRVCDASVYSIEHALAAVLEMSNEQPCRVLYLRGRKLIQLSRSESGKWEAGAIELNADQMRKLALGTGRT